MNNTRHNYLKKVICQRISEMSPGMKLPTEFEFVKEFNVSRMTVNKVICELEKEGYVIRRRHYGTFVKERSMKTRIVTFLLPFPDDIISNAYSSFYRRGLLSGIMEAVKTTGCRLETLSVSPSNDINDIDPELINHLNQDSLVIVTGTWYARLFKMFYDQGCKVSFLDEQILYSYTEEQKYTEDWFIGDMDIKQGIYEMAVKLYKKGYRRIALMSPYLQYPGHPRKEGYLRAVKECGLPEIIYPMNRVLFNKVSEDEAKFLADNDCDAVILDASDMIGCIGDNINQVLGISEKIKVATLLFRAKDNYLTNNPLNFVFNYKQIGYESAMRLLSDKEEEKIKIYKPIFSEVD